MQVKLCAFVCPLLLCLLFPAEPVHAQTVPAHDLNGTWTLPDGTVIRIVQTRDRVQGRVLVPSPQFVHVWGWSSNELYLEGVVAGGEFSGKRYVRFPVDSKELCPQIPTATQRTDLEFQVTDRNALMGRYRNRVLWNNCTVTEASWVSIELTRKKFDVAETSSQIDIRVRDGILFDLDSDRLKPDALIVLTEIKTLVFDKQRFVRMLVEGHTDDQGSDSHNEDLSARRARAVARWLSQHGFQSNLDAKGYGKRVPVLPNTSDANRARNRRVEIKLIK